MKKIILILGLVSILLSSCDTKKVELAGAGATFPVPYYNVAFESYKAETGNSVSYGGIGSGGGIRSIAEGIVDFAGTDAFLNDERMAEIKEVIHIPSCLGAVVLSYTLEGITELNLTGEIIADMYMGKITTWNDARIQAINPKITLPNKKITPIFRSDGSGTTAIFANYLSKVSPEWKNTLGEGTSLNFATGVGGKGNPGVAGTIAVTDGSIGYIGSEYAFALNLPIASIQNTVGEFILPNTNSISAAAQGEIPADTRVMITNSTAAGSYPISGFTWIVVYKEQAYGNRSIEKAKATIEMLQFLLSDKAQALTGTVHYAPLSKDVIALSEKNIKTITYQGKPIE
ncbi:MAG: phosphate ABC transporter substrate-binding protein PstS [Paludibacteraceae bacterium]|nr:phosphate ABC transporter substrate-binding protein PstS [Paludibacteraceae bacterium]MBP6284092.1 phosphate ABC transporter substrate-binding protein PstS [Paludibacteraceae bacterium]